MSTLTEEDAPRRIPLIRMSGVTKRFPGVVALDGVDLEVYPGERVALVGENGAGKSTLMKLLSGVESPDQGTIEIDGAPVELTSPAQARSLGVSIIHQELGLVPDLTVAQNIFLGRERTRFGVLDRRGCVRDTSALLDRLGMVIDPDARVRDLTVGKQQMVEIARALSEDARLLILDEPTAALNEAEVQTLFELIDRFVTDATGVIYISHRMDELARISDRIVVLRDGVYVGQRPTATTPMREIIEMMVGREVADEQRPTIPEKQGEVVLKVEGLSSSHPLHDISFELHRGEILGFAGLMGAGRTELARAIVGADPITAGRIEVAGTERKIDSPATAAKYGIGYLSEDRKRFGAVVDQTVRDNIALSSLDAHATLGVIRDRELSTLATDMVTRLRIKTPSIRQAVRNLSGGNQQKVIIGKWLARDCDILIVDEPTRGIDVGAKDEIYRLLEHLAASGKAIMVISSDLPEVLRLSHRIAVMGEGRLATIVDSDNATQETIMQNATRFHETAVK
ncbi:ABC transporter related protein OS=Tsukamurella paurometabola (strain ATCC 8368 / DSM / CCUG 35730 / CIP 100753 / JCM 10117 / KCTC 9821 / NBRC 16120 / NCIMB 702349 / NCTC 13040) OX=521096 GN=Tpau_3104 PE=4 SV=1 [Tsukamurella paurometabola]|uniref:ABC transporter related protein n=1 Tax=Tsukamurella paurometabola (strain ATCC 8368 / DSM 20162 / CCUG 35730 / CIP 100753 / JCM 10117 / KCTC 9821 / NBRC 16120 / NCIMB 702349 / NCTC 13040) TaxID=521096 RepID=D5UUX5_TSUPD|nr:sugar ABC transporter ATP-binding protein [Tsukamurella paurometabola]ADG79693.1 ABC transporter related protein [Tsukamurella paurometabola DSM 20162]SUP36800.1 Ribose import ATP-binding protein RbsA [Tsukamurella paurometabola]